MRLLQSSRRGDSGAPHSAAPHSGPVGGASPTGDGVSTGHRFMPTDTCKNPVAVERDFEMSTTLRTVGHGVCFISGTSQVAANFKRDGGSSLKWHR